MFVVCMHIHMIYSTMDGHIMPQRDSTPIEIYSDHQS